MTRRDAWRELRPFVPAAVVLALYAGVRALYLALAGARGLLTPTGDADAGLVVLGAAALLLRLAALVGVPLFVVLRLVARGARRWTERREPSTAERARPEAGLSAPGARPPRTPS